jgi:glycine C-acetyltransferase
LFSNAVAPAVVAGSLAALDLVTSGTQERAALAANAERFRALMTAAGFDLLPGAHPIVPVMIGDAARAARIAEAMLDQGVYVIAFSYPVVPQGRARIRVQLSAAHTEDDVRTCVNAFIAARDA